MKLKIKAQAHSEFHQFLIDMLTTGATTYQLQEAEVLLLEVTGSSYHSCKHIHLKFLAW